jgi:hypothetical protein
MTTANAPAPILAPKRYDDDSDTPTRRVPFIAVFRRDGIAEDHQFLALPAIDYKATIEMASAAGGDTMRQVRAMMRLIRRCLVDDDGVSVHHMPAEGEDAPPFAEGSSRRRWVHLMEHDDDATISDRVITAMYTDLFKAAAGGRPTSR